MRFRDFPHGNAALAIFPSVAGFGWMLFDGPLSVVASGVSTVAKSARTDERKNARSLRRIERLLKAYRPATLVLEAFEGRGTRRHGRIRALCRSVIALAATEGIRVRIITRHEIRAMFVSRRVRTRQDAADATAAYIREIRWKLPTRRRMWESEKPNMALFNATMLLIVHYANPEEPL